MFPPSPSCRSVDGSLLLKLTDEQLKRDLGMLPLGHRAALLKAIERLHEGAKELEKSMRGPLPMAGRVSRRWPVRSLSSRWPGKFDIRLACPLQAGHHHLADDPRMPASASPGVVPAEPYLGPALGKVRDRCLASLLL